MKSPNRAMGADWRHLVTETISLGAFSFVYVTLGTSFFVGIKRVTDDDDDDDDDDDRYENDDVGCCGHGSGDDDDCDDDDIYENDDFGCCGYISDGDGDDGDNIDETHDGGCSDDDESADQEGDHK
ncbi:prostatic spermine-binding protein-like [Gigantopelta aegis]|uniref:prostatic spermine-binding protein-like n=1 Tax=Gigantopelta aegis TaxID=1735272 RepID=UPI001B8890E1|nr:prostatic spermine-binding protein-like [Gigantopelta aegis]